MKAFVLTGETGRGKSSEAVRLVNSFSQKDLYVYDHQGQWRDFKRLKIKGVPTMDEFVDIVSKVVNSVIVFEEATVFFKNNKGRMDKIINLLISSHHRQNVVIFLFHSLRSVPVDIMDHVQFIRLYHTNDRATLIKAKFKDDPDLLRVFLDVKRKTQGTGKNRITGIYDDKRSEQFYHYSRVYTR
jgi:hypothetical protein